MTRTEAEEIANKLARRHPDRTRYRWSVRESPKGEWMVVKVGVPPGDRVDPPKATEAQANSAPAKQG